MSRRKRVDMEFHLLFTMSCARDSIRHSRAEVIIELPWQLCNLSQYAATVSSRRVCLCASIKLLLGPVIANTERMYYFVQYITTSPLSYSIIAR